MSSNAKPLRVNILDKEYLVACPDGEREALFASAEFLTKKMKEIRDSGKIVGADRIAVMAALNMAHDIIALDRNGGSEAGSCGERIRRLNTRIGEAMDKFRLAGLD